MAPPFFIDYPWVCPAGITSITVECWGSGGGGYIGAFFDALNIWRGCGGGAGGSGPTFGINPPGGAGGDGAVVIWKDGEYGGRRLPVLDRLRQIHPVIRRPVRVSLS